MTKRPKSKRPKGQNVPRQNVPRHKVPGTKRPKGKNVPRDKMSHNNTQVSKINFVLENWPHVLGNGPHPCTQFIILVFLFWGG